ncbi:choice-of-anchor L domain-containing protein [Salinarchaeum sp. IM2453]|uniref:choice-of-anchor L domain-containing protein n=1 Tax=Salinarchaeum sp. IM2453 TaxID=2862870 RepID=UPI001C83260A|nr:choice-of-anchor L domain-containing protein [Salinarchaeum sp. IM2453]QZA88508.1 choice-of-anchor L domain-containing protein [Salinarchaeum sp. IM2453]
MSRKDSDKPVHQRLVSLSRRKAIQLSGTLPIVKLPSVASADKDGDLERKGEKRSGSDVAPLDLSSNAANVISTEKFEEKIEETAFRGVNEQLKIFSEELQGFPHEGDEFVVISSGDAGEASNHPEFFASTWWENDRHISDYSPDGYDAFCVAELDVTFRVPEGAEGIAFDYKFGTEENPTFLGSIYQDFFEALLYEPDDVTNIAQIDGNPVTVDSAAGVSNAPNGSSVDPEPPFPEPSDVAYNAVTELQTVTHDISNHQGETLTLRFRIADASDGLYDSAVFLDNLRFTDEVERDLLPLEQELESFESAFKGLLNGHMEAQAHYTALLYEEFRSDYADLVTDYWGYKAGEIPGNELDEEPRDIADASLNSYKDESDYEITDGQAMDFYRFYDELFDNLEDKDEIEVIKEITYQHYVGEYPGQEYPFSFDEGERFIDIMEDDWEIVGAAVDQIMSNHDPTQSEIQSLATIIQDLTNRLSARKQELIEAKEHEAEALISAGDEDELEVSGQVFEDSTDLAGDEVGVQIGPAKFALIILGLGILGKGAGYLTTRCSGTFVLSRHDAVEHSTVSVSRPDRAFLSQVNSGINMITHLSSFADVMEEDGLETEFAGSVFVGGFKKGSVTAGKSLVIETLELSLQWALAQDADAEIRFDKLPDVTEKAELGLWDRFIHWGKSFWDWFWPWYSYSRPEIGEAEGKITIENTGNTIFTPVIGSDYRLFDGEKISGAGFAVDFDGDNSPMYTGDTRSFDVTYQAPLDEGIRAGEIDIEIGMKPEADAWDPPTDIGDFLPISLCETDYIETGDRVVESFGVGNNTSVETINENDLAEGETDEFSYIPEEDSESVFLSLHYTDHYADFLLIDEDGNRTGRDDGETVTEIPDSIYSGRDTGERNREWILLEDVHNEEYTVRVHAPVVGTVPGNNEGDEGSGEEIKASSLQIASNLSSLSVPYKITSTAVPTLPPFLDISPSNITFDEPVARGDSPEFAIVLSETNEDTAINQVELVAGDLEHVDNEQSISGDHIKFESTSVSLDAGERKTVETTINIPRDASSGMYTGNIEVTGSDETAGGDSMIELTINVQLAAEDYADPDGVIRFNGLRDAIADWRNGVITKALLEDVIDAWRTRREID